MSGVDTKADEQPTANEDMNNAVVDQPGYQQGDANESVQEGGVAGVGLSALTEEEREQQADVPAACAEEEAYAAPAADSAPTAPEEIIEHEEMRGSSAEDDDTLWRKFTCTRTRCTYCDPQPYCENAEKHSKRVATLREFRQLYSAEIHQLRVQAKFFLSKTCECKRISRERKGLERALGNLEVSILRFLLLAFHPIFSQYRDIFL